MNVNLNLTIPDEAATSIESSRLNIFIGGTNLASAVDSKATEISVMDAFGITVGTHVLLEDEEVAIQTGNGSKFTVSRTAPVAHGAGTIIRILRYADAAEVFKGLLLDQLKQVLISYPSLTIRDKQAVIDAKKSEIEVFLKTAVS